MLRSSAPSPPRIRISFPVRDTIRVRYISKHHTQYNICITRFAHEIKIKDILNLLKLLLLMK